MNCKHCKTDNSLDAEYCSNCGKKLNEEIKGSVDTYFAIKNRGCQICKSLADTKYVEFYQNIGMLFARQHSNIKGRLCKRCINSYFKKMTLTTLLLGWWGTISFIITPFILLNNLGRFVTTLNMKEE